jgi:predicted TIM-barrel enzyme
MSPASPGIQSAPVIIGATASGTFAAQLARAGADRVAAYHSSVYRQRGLPSVAGLLPWGSANQQTLDILPDVVRGAGDTPVIATICANDALMPVADMLPAATDRGAAGVLNAPTVGLLSGSIREVLEEEGLGRAAEMRLITQAREAGLEAWAYVFDGIWSQLALDAGASGLIIHLGITGHPLAPGLPAARLVQEAVAPILESRRDVPVLLHGGELRAPADAAALCQKLDQDTSRSVNGFFGASAFEASRPDGRTLTQLLADWRTALCASAGSPQEGIIA